MNGAKVLLESRMENAIQAKCWRVVCARIRDIALMMEREEGIPIADTYEKYNYKFYRSGIKREFQ